MAQLSNDCFAFGGPLLTVDEVRALVGERLATVAGSTIVPLLEADGRILAEPVVAPIDLPPFDNAAVDGYAVRFADLASDTENVWPLRGRVVAGADPTGIEGSRAAVRIFTGAPMPRGLDTVFMQEDVSLRDGKVVLPSGLKLGANRRLAGEDLARGGVALEAGRKLGPRDVALLAALGLSEIRVLRPLRVAVLSTGNEIVSPGEPLRPASLYDANRFMLLVMLRRLGCAATDLGI